MAGPYGSLTSRAIIGEFYRALETAAVPAWVSALSFRAESNQESETYKWLGMSPAMREWIGGRDAKGLRENGLTITNKLFESTLKVPLDDLRRDKTGQLRVRIRELANRSALHPASLMSTLILAGESTACYDGQFFFDTDHAEGSSGAQSNDIVFDISDAGTGGTATAPTPLTVQRAILAAVAQMMGFKDDQGEPMNETAAEFIAMVPPTYMGATITALTSQTIGSLEENALANGRGGFRVTPVINPRLTSWTTKLAVFRSDGEVKPMIFQEEQDTMMDAIAEGSELEIKERQHIYGASRICNVGYGYWQHACLVTLQA